MFFFYVALVVPAKCLLGNTKMYNLQVLVSQLTRDVLTAEKIGIK